MTDKTRDIPELGKGGPAMTREEAISRIQDHMERHRIGKYPHIRLAEAFDLALTALSTLQAENAQLRADLEYEREHANAYYEECGQWEAENTQLKEKLEALKVEQV